MFEKIVYEYFFINLKDYPNINIDFEINVFLLILTVALSVCFFISTYYRHGMQRIMKQLARFGAKDEETAKTLGELGLGKAAVIKYALSRENRLTRIVGRVGEPKYTYEEYIELEKKKGGIPREKIDFSTARFYIREEKIGEAKHIIETYGTSIVRTILYCVFFMALYVCIALLMPEILTGINALIGNM